jgi:hypothetical protein
MENLENEDKGKSHKPDSERTKSRFQRIQPIVSLSCEIGMVAVTLIGVIVVICQLGQFAEQNKLLHTTLKQSFRPIGVFGIAHPLGDTVLLEGRSGSKPGKFDLRFDPLFKNAGEGPLVFLGYVSLVSPDKMDFRTKFLAEELDTFAFDNMDPFTRRLPVLPGESVGGLKIGWTELNYEDEYYIYGLFFYEDQEGNLFDSQLGYKIRLSGAKAGASAGEIIPEIEPEARIHESFSEYSQADRLKLIRIFQRHGHNLANFISRES